MKKISFVLAILWTVSWAGFSYAISLGNSPLEDMVINVANSTGKAVVSISTEQVSKFGGTKKFYFNSPQGQDQSFEGDEFFRRFFEDFFGEIPEQEYRQMGLGSGVIIDAEGYILTNEHVINDADKITVTLPDGREFKGELKGKDARSDLAVIKINAHNLPVANLGDSDNLRIGQWLVAIGNPFGFALENPEPTVTVGVVSALRRSLGRTMGQDRDYTDLIQTDAAINPGNSGGPLVNLKGEVIGVNVAIFSTSGGYQGIGFAVPINKAKRIINRLIEGKKIVYGWLGVSIQDLNDDLAGYFGVNDKKGVVVVKVHKSSPAEKSGLKERDVVKAVDGAQVNNVRELQSAIGKLEVGKKIKLTIVRNKKEIFVPVEIGPRPEDVFEEKESVEVASQSWRGIEVDNLDERVAKRFQLDEKLGVLIKSIKPNSPADNSGMIAPDVILEINREPVKDISGYNRITKNILGAALIKTSRGYYLLKAEGGK
ncbi:MAG: Do family serine endopeptidase [Candidatus Omnitrophota bacterium]|nr:Do family serine endopeptidase [Candidatus Omnitrophota bacterium]